MINFLLGRPGGGKSYEAVVYHVIPALEKGRKVITNLPLDLARFSEIDATWPALIELRTMGKDAVRPFSLPQHYGDPWRHPDDGSGPFYVIDECHLAMPAGGTVREVEEWYSLHRHESADVLLITQSYGKVSKSIRELCQVSYWVSKNTALGMAWSYTRKVRDGLRGEFVNEGQRYYKKRYFALYKSHTRGGGAELGASDMKPIWQHWSFKGAALALLVVAYLFVSGKVHVPWSRQSREAAPVAAGSKPPAKVTVQNQPGRQPGAPKLAAQAGASKSDPEPYADRGLHIAGRLRMGGRDRLVVVVSQNGQLVTVTDSDALKRAGYAVEVLDDCVAQVRYGGRTRALICDAPQIGPGLPSGGSSSAPERLAKADEEKREPVTVITDPGEWRGRQGYKMIDRSGGKTPTS
jgi:zona occludens toxin